MMVFIQRPISGTFIGICVLLLAGVTWSALRGRKRGLKQESVAEEVLESAHVPQAQIDKTLTGDTV
jgi:hypothetical protein